MIKTRIIAAMDLDGHIGYKGDLPWGDPIPEDMERFRDLTLGLPIIMGRVTFNSIGRILPDRYNVILTRNQRFYSEALNGKKEGENFAVANSIPEAYFYAVKWIKDNWSSGNVASPTVCVIGGQRVYEQFIPVATEMCLTCIKDKFPGDRHFPDFPTKLWEKASDIEFVTSEWDELKLMFTTIKRKER